MKKIAIIISTLVITAVFFSSCTKEVGPTETQDKDMVLVNLSLTGEVELKETLLTKSTSSNDLIGVQVFQGSSYYAYGLFDDVSKMNIYLHSGEKYKFVCTVVKNGKDLVFMGNDTSPHNGIELKFLEKRALYYLGKGKYGLPFLVFGNSYNSGDGVMLSNEFNYSSVTHYKCLEYGAITSGNYRTIETYPKGDRFYGLVSNYEATNNGSLSIPMKRVGFGLTLSVSGITDGEVAVTIKNSDKTFANNTGIKQDTKFGTTMWSFFDLASAYQYADNYAENFTVGVVWKRGVGVTQDLGTKVVQFKRNSVNHVKINLSSSTKSSGVAITLEEPVITTENYTFGN